MTQIGRERQAGLACFAQAAQMLHLGGNRIPCFLLNLGRISGGLLTLLKQFVAQLRPLPRCRGLYTSRRQEFGSCACGLSQIKTDATAPPENAEQLQSYMDCVCIMLRDMRGIVDRDRKPRHRGGLTTIDIIWGGG